jgi:hypothetical protein
MAVTGLPSNHVNVLNRRSGGAFGGKITRMVPVVASATLGAYVTGKQVHVQLDRSQDMIMVRVSALCGAVWCGVVRCGRECGVVWAWVLCGVGVGVVCTLVCWWTLVATV